MTQYLRLLRYALPYKRLVGVQLGCMLLTVGFGLLKPWPLKVIVDNVLGRHDLVIGSGFRVVSPEILLLGSCIAYIVLHAGESLVQYVASVVSTIANSRMIRDLRSDLLRCLQTQAMKFHDNRKLGDTIYRLTANTTAAETAFQSGFMGTIKSLMNLIGILTVMILMNPGLTLVAASVVPFLFASIRWYAKRIHRVSLEHQNQEGAISSRAQEILSSIRLIKAYTREEQEQKLFEDLADASVRTRVKSTTTQNSFGLVVAAILAVGTALLYWFGVGQVQSGSLTIGQFLVFNAYLGMLYSPLSVLSYTASSVQSSLGGATRLFEILDSPIEIQDRPGARSLAKVDGSIEFAGVSFGYRAGEETLSEISFRANPGDLVVLVGQTGGGKSTVLSLLLRFYECTSGAISVDGVEIRDLTLESLRKNIGFSPQEAVLLSDSIRENIAYGRPTASTVEIVQAAVLAEADEFIVRTKDGYDTLVGERGVFLSAGQRQRIALARALLRDASILLLDEPTSSLDMETESRILHNIGRIRNGKTVIIAAHRLAVARAADLVVVLERGRVVEMGTHEDLLARNGPYNRLWNAQHQPSAMMAPEIA